MRLICQAWFRWVDSELDRELTLPDPDATDPGEWNRLVGLIGERLAGKYLWRTGGKVLYRNFRARHGGEVDIVYRDGDILVFAEVKTRTTTKFGRPADAVNRVKERLVIRGANAWLRELNHPEVIIRFDIVEVVLVGGKVPEVVIIKEAFQTPQVGVGM